MYVSQSVTVCESSNHAYYNTLYQCNQLNSLRTADLDYILDVDCITTAVAK